MRIYLRSSASTPYGVMGKGWHTSELEAAKQNVEEAEMVKYFKALCSSGMAELVSETKATAKTTKAKTATKPSTKEEK